MPIGQATMDALVGRIYDAALDHRAWQRVTEEIAAATGSPLAFLGRMTQDTGTSFGVVAERDPVETLIAYKEIRREDPLLSRSFRVFGCGNAGVGAEMMRLRDLRRTRYYADYARHYGAVHVLGVNLIVEDDRLWTMGLYRPEQAPGHTPEEVDLLQHLVPHMQRALQITERLHQANRMCGIAEATLDRLNTGVLVVTRDRRVLLANRYARRVLEGGECLRLAADRLLTTVAATTKRLDGLIRRAAETGAGGAMAIRRPAATPLQLLVVPVRPAHPLLDGMRSDGAVLVAAIDRELERGSGESVLMDLFGLTRAEARLAEAIANGVSVKAHAAARRLSEHTVRTQLRSIFEKTGTQRQSQLAALIAPLMLTGHREGLPTLPQASQTPDDP